ncbi:MAG TPA: hypothetical protein VFR84_14845 [Candidatus Angelobacter sp.]|nr:hypothetical protein [Candidatus Angelobacter sp.]
MTITFADGTRIDVPASGFDDFLKHDLKWVEFVHGSASKPVLLNGGPHLPPHPTQDVRRCPSCSC